MLNAAMSGGYAIGAFNVENMEMVQAVILAAEEMDSPVIIQTTPSTVKYAGLRMYYAMVAALTENAKVPVALHLDHGDSFELASDALDAGYTSLMIDGSHKSFEDNVLITSKVVKMARDKGIPVEAELGKVGGKEDSVDGGAGGYTDPAKAKEFVELSGASSLAVAIGTAHGMYASAPCLDIDRLAQIRGNVDVPLILHGASGLSDEQVRDCILHGICKVNFATELRSAFRDGVRDFLGNNPDVIDPKGFGAAGRDFVKQAVISRISVCGCAGRARSLK